MLRQSRSPGGAARLSHRIAAAAALLLTAACASAPARAPAPAHASTYSRSRELLPADLARYRGEMLAGAMRRVRPNFTTSFRGQAVTVYVDGRPFDWLTLHTIRAEQVARVRLLTPVEAALEYGSFAPGPILDVRTRP